MRAPSVYIYKKSDKGHGLYLGEFSTLEGLSLIEPKSKVRLSSFGCENYNGLEWASEVDLPQFTDVESVCQFLDLEDAIGLVDFGVDIGGVGSLSTHDDGECQFIMDTSRQWVGLVEAVARESQASVLIDALVSNPGCYLTISVEGEIEVYASFEGYLDRKA